MTWYFRGCCDPVLPVVLPTPTPPPTPLPSPAYSYDSTRLSDPTLGGSASRYTSASQAYNAGSAATAISPFGSVDDLALMIPTGASVSANYSGGVTSVTVPANAIVIGATDGSFDVAVTVTDGTHTASIPAFTSAGGGNAILITAGFTVYAMGGAIPLSALRAKGMCDSGSNLAWKWVLVPSGAGNVTITSVVVT